MGFQVVLLQAGIASVVACSMLFPGTPRAEILGRWKVESAICAGGVCAYRTPAESARYLAQVQGLTLDLHDGTAASQVSLGETGLLSCEQGVDVSDVKSRNTWAFVETLPKSSRPPANAFERFLESWSEGNGVNPLRTNLAYENLQAGKIRCNGNREPVAWVIQAKPDLLDYYDPETQDFLILRREKRKFAP